MKVFAVITIVALGGCGASEPDPTSAWAGAKGENKDNLATSCSGKCIAECVIAHDSGGTHTFCVDLKANPDALDGWLCEYTSINTLECQEQGLSVDWDLASFELYQDGVGGRLTNYGTGDSPATTIRVSLFSAANVVARTEFVPIPTIPPRGSYQWKHPLAAPSQYFAIEILIDPDNEVAEPTETDNVSCLYPGKNCVIGGWVCQADEPLCNQ